MAKIENATGETGKQKTPRIVGAASIFSALWFIGTVWMFFWAPLPTQCPGPIRCMSLNEVGDFIAGASAPLAFLWLVVAVFIQASELAEQREELRLTRLEFEQSRKVMEQQAVEAKKQAEFIGTQTEILQSQNEEYKSKELERELETKISEIGAIIKNNLDRKNIIIAMDLSEEMTGEFFSLSSRFNEESILELTNMLTTLGSRHLRRPFLIPDDLSYYFSRIYELCVQLDQISSTIGQDARHRLVRLKIPELQDFIATIVSEQDAGGDATISN